MESGTHKLYVSASSLVKGDKTCTCTDIVRAGQSQSHLKMLCTFIRILSVRPSAG